jgi:mono/diheme cytochrome c family protein
MNLFFSLFFITCSGFSNALEADEEFFESRIRPVLYDRCIGCHGASEQQGGLRLDSRDAILGGGDSGPALVPGKPEESLLLKAIRHDNAGLMMPPPEAGAKLSQATIDDFSTWIKNGVDPLILRDE